MISPLLCGTDKAAVVDSSATSPIQRASSTSSETVGSRGRPSSSGRGGRSRSVDDMLETTGGESPFSKAKKLVTPSRMRSFAELFRSDRLSSTSPPTAKGGGGGDGGKAVTFGVPLSELCSQSPGGIPNLVAKVTQFVEDCCLDMEGVYRLSPNARIIETLKAEFDKTGDADLKDADPASVSCLLKLFLRELPEPLIPMEVLQQVVKRDTDYPPPSSYLEFLHEVMLEIPPPNYALLKYLIRHLHIVSRHHAENKMNPANLAIVFGPNFFSFGGSLDFLQNQTSSMPALRTMIEYYKDIFCDQPLGKGRVGPAVPKPYKQHRADAVVYEEVNFPRSAVDRSATSDSGIYEVVQPALPPLSRGHGLHSSSSSNDEVFKDIAPDDHHVMQNGVMYAVVNKKRKPTSTDGKRDTTITTDGKRDTTIATDGKRDTTNPTDGKRDTPTSTDGKRDTATSTDGGVCSSRPSGYDGYKEIDVNLAMDRKKGGHLVASSADVTPRREQVEEADRPRSPSPVPLNSSPSPYNSPCLTPRRAKALDEAISETVQDLLFNPLQTGQPLKDDSWITVSARETDLSAARQTDMSTAGQTDVSAARQTDLSAVRQTDMSTARQTDMSAARQMRRHKKSSKEGVENRSQSLDGDASSVARRQLVISDHKLRNRSSGAYFAASLDVLEHQEDSPDGSREGDSPEQTVRQRLKMFDHKPVMGLLPDSGTKAAGASLEGSVEQTDGNSFVFEGVTLSRAAPLHHLTKTRVKGPRSRRPSGGGKAASANSEGREGEITRQSPPVTVELAKPESEPAAGNHVVVTEEQRGVVHRKLSGGSNAGVVNGALVLLVEVMQQIQSTLREKRKKCGRPEELHEMSWEQLLDEKKSVQTAILQFEKQHGRPQTKSGKDVMKPVYHRYRDIKKRISDGRVAHEVARKCSPSPEHSTLEATLPNVTLSHSLPPQLWREGGTKVASEMVAQRGLATPTGWGPNPASTPSASTAAHGQSLVLEDQKAKWEEEKNALRKKLRAFEKAFEAKHGRMPVKADRPGPIDCQYSEYKRVKGRLRSTSVEAVTAAQLHQTV